MMLTQNFVGTKKSIMVNLKMAYEVPIYAILTKVYWMFQF